MRRKKSHPAPIAIETTQPTRKLSEAGRARISAATKKRWAKVKANQQPQTTSTAPPLPNLGINDPIDAVLSMKAEELLAKLETAKAIQAEAGRRVEMLAELYRKRSGERSMTA